MSHYLLSVMEPDGPTPAPEFLEPIMQAVGAVDEAMRDAGIWVYAGGLHDPTPIGFYFAKLWYFEKLYPIIFAVAALGRARRLSQT